MLRSFRVRKKHHRVLATAALATGIIAAGLPTGDLLAQGMSQMGNMPGMGASATANNVGGTGTVAAVNVAARKVTIDHEPILEMKWPAMTMEFAIAPSVDISKLKTGDKVGFTFSGSDKNYTMQSVDPVR